MVFVCFVILVAILLVSLLISVFGAFSLICFELMLCHYQTSNAIACFARKSRLRNDPLLCRSELKILYSLTHSLTNSPSHSFVHSAVNIWWASRQISGAYQYLLFASFPLFLKFYSSNKLSRLAVRLSRSEKFVIRWLLVLGVDVRPTRQFSDVHYYNLLIQQLCVVHTDWVTCWAITNTAEKIQREFNVWIFFAEIVRVGEVSCTIFFVSPWLKRSVTACTASSRLRFPPNRNNLRID